MLTQDDDFEVHENDPLVEPDLNDLNANAEVAEGAIVDALDLRRYARAEHLRYGRGMAMTPNPALFNNFDTIPFEKALVNTTDAMSTCSIYFYRTTPITFSGIFTCSLKNSFNKIKGC